LTHSSRYLSAPVPPRCSRDRSECIAFVPRVDDFVAVGEPLYRLYGNAAQIDGRKLRAQVAFGPERSMEQDSNFVFRGIVDIGVKALSPAINDPATAVMAIDQLHRLLSVVGRRHLHEDALLDANGSLRLIFQTRPLACRPIP
jgi:uncharacterized membrane protein